MQWILGVIGIGVLAFGVLAFRKRTFTYADAMKYLIDAQKITPSAVKGSLIKQEVPGGYIITISLLDKNGNVIKGSKIKASKLDDELTRSFKDKNVVIVE